MAYISGKYTSATEYSITLGGMAIGTVYAILVQDLNSDGSSNGFVCKWKSGATSSTYTDDYTTSATYSRYDRRIGFFQGSFNTKVGTVVSDDNFDKWADGQAVIKAWGGGGGGPTPKKHYYYQVKLYGNGGVFSDGSKTYSTYWWPKDDVASSETTSPKVNTSSFPSPTRNGYRLTGWAKTSNGTPTSQLTFTATSTDADSPTLGNEAYAIWAARQVLVYDYNGGRYGNETGTSSIYVDKGATFEVSRVPSKDGYSFVGWKRTYDNKIYQEGQTFIVKAEKEVLTAQWEAPFKFRLSDTNEGLVSFQVNRYASQGGDLLESKTISSTNFIEIVARDSNYIEITNAITAVIKDGTKEINRNGFTAPLITARADSSSNQDQNEYLKIKIEGSVTQSPVYGSYGFRAGLRPNHHTFLVGSFAKSYKYSLDANKGYWTEDESTNPKKSSVKSTEQVDFSKYSSLVKRIGYKLEGWGLSATGRKVTVPNGKYWITDDTNFYAIWAARQVLVYNYDGGRYGEETGSSSIYVDKGSTFEVSRVPSKDGYSFVGWKRTYDNKIYQEGQTFIVKAEKEVLTAQWEAPFKFRLSDTNEGLVSFQVNRYASQGGDLLESKTISSTNFIEIVARDSNYIEITNAITAVIKDGTKEINRNGFTAPLITARADSSSNQDQNEYLKIKIEGSVTQSPVYGSYGFRAGLRPNHHTFLVGSFAKSYKYSLDANKGYWTEDESTNPKKSSVKSTEQVDFSKYSSLVKRIGYKLEGWGLSATGRKVTVPNGKYWITDDTNFYAIWQAQPHIILDANGGKFDGTLSTKDFYIDYGDVLDFSQYKPSWYGEGSYILLGWAENPASTSPTYGVNEVIGPLYGAGPYKYYAVWQKSRATLTFHGNGGLWYGNLQEQSKTYKVGETVSFATYSNDLVRAGYSLLGWSTSPTATDAPWDPNGIVTVGATDADYYAVWQKHIDLFYWYGNDTQDAAKIAKGQPVTNLTATIWNEFKSRINQLTIAETGSSWSYSAVSSGDSITAAEVLAARNALAALNNNVPLPTANQLQTGKQILASYFNGTGSLKAALNIIINNYNKS